MAHVPDRILDKLRCNRCTSFLSYGPVAILSNGESLCGRCTIPGSNIFRAHAYEAVAIYFLFPCKYWRKHCAYYLNWNEVAEHEAKCTFKSTCNILFSAPGSLFKPENKLDFTKTIKVFNIPEPVLEFLTCSTCEHYLSSTPIFVNNEGKSSCHRCFAAKGQVPNGFIQQFALEKILEIMLFPCVYRHRGCTHFFRFGLDTTAHEQDCSYGKVQRRPTTTKVDGKEKGVIETHWGHTYGTITPHTPIFVVQSKKPSVLNYNSMEPLRMQPTEVQDRFFNQLKKHRQNLEYKWRNSKLEQIDYNQFARENPNFQRQISDGGSDNSQFFRYSDANQKQLSPENQFTKAPQFIYPDANRSGSENSNSSDSVGNYSQQLQVPRMTQNDLSHSNSFSYFDRFERSGNMQRNGSLLYNQNDAVPSIKTTKTDSLRNGMAPVYPTEVHYGGRAGGNNIRY